MTPPRLPTTNKPPLQAGMPASPSPHLIPCDQLITLVEKVDALERWKASTEWDLKEIREVIIQVKLLMSLSIGGGGLSIISLIVTIAALAAWLK